MWYQIKSYIKFLINSKNKHGIHSPFVYELATKCFYDKFDHSEYSIIRSIRNEYNSNHNVIEIKQFGEGSRVFRSNNRPISSITKNSGITYKNQKLLFRLIRYFNSSSMLELGTSLGLATSAMSLANPYSMIQSVEGCLSTAKCAKQMFKEHGLNNISLSISSFEEFLSKKLVNDMVFDLIYLDGNHNKVSTLNYYKALQGHIDDHSIIILDDIHWSPEMNQAWFEIIERPEVTVSIDTYNWGLLFFRKELQKQHFQIRL